VGSRVRVRFQANKWYGGTVTKVDNTKREGKVRQA
jgi:Holliday junction resolvase-like predicted endonuclease